MTDYLSIRQFVTNRKSLALRLLVTEKQLKRK